MSAPPVDLVALTAQLVEITSPSFEEQQLVEWLEARLRACGHLEVTRIGDNLVARTTLGRSDRIILAGHTDTVPSNGNERARLDGDTLWGLGSADMKGGLAVMLAAAEHLASPIRDVTFVFYAREEVAAAHSGLAELVDAAPELLQGDLAILGEPTAGQVEAGCQGTIRVRVTLRGARAHSARPWMGRNAIHRAGPLLDALASYEPRTPELAGCQFREALLAVGIDGGISGNVVPDAVEVTIGHRFAPDRSAEQAETWLRDWLAPHLDDGDTVEVVDVAAGAYPASEHPMLRAAIEAHGLDVTAKLGWTDVARFAALGVAAANLGPGDPLVAHTAEERVERMALDRTWSVIVSLLAGP